MLSDFSFNDFFSEYNLKSIDNKELLLATLLSFKNLNTTQIHKLAFLTFAEEKTIIPFEFIKMPHGPFSNDIKSLLANFSERKLITMNKEVHGNWEENIWVLSEDGQKLIEKNKAKVEEIKKKLESVINMYDGSTAKALERYCYNNYLLKNANEKSQDYEARIKTSIDNLHTLLSNRVRDLENVEDIDESSKTVILACFDYIDNLLKSLSNKEIDQVIRGVLIKKTENYINIWGEILRLIGNDDNESKVRNLLKDSKELFNFINVSSERYGVFESVF